MDSNESYSLHNEVHKGFVRGLRSVLLFSFGYPVLIFFIATAPLFNEFDVALIEFLLIIALFSIIPAGLAISAFLVLGTLTGGFVAILSVLLKSRVKLWQFQLLVFLLTVFISTIILHFFADVFDNITRAETDLNEVLVPGIKNSILVLVIPLVFYVAATTRSSKGAFCGQ